MKSTTIDKMINEFDSLKYDEKEFAMDVLRKILSEARRNAIARRARQAVSNFKSGKVKKGNVSQLFNDLENG